MNRRARFMERWFTPEGSCTVCAAPVAASHVRGCRVALIGRSLFPLPLLDCGECGGKHRGSPALRDGPWCPLTMKWSERSRYL